MKWINHIAIAGATTAVINPVLVPVAILGSTAPDWLEWLSKALGHKIEHRTTTHIVLYWVIALVFFLGVYDYMGIGAAFAYGGLTHVMADSLTIMGIPLTPFSDRRWNFMGGRLRTGGSGEFIVAGCIAAVCFFLAGHFYTQSEFLPFFYNWGELYEEGLIDAYEWKKNRFNFI